MALRRLYNLTTGTLDPNQMTNLNPGGAGSSSANANVNPGISAPRIEEMVTEVLDVTAPTLIISGTTAATPAPVGKLLVMDWYTGAFGARWKLNSVVKQAIPGGQFGIVVSAGQNTVAANGSVDPAVGTNNGNEAQNGSKALVLTDGPVQAFVQTTVQNTAISAGMGLAADGAGNLTYAGQSPSTGTTLAIYTDAVLGAGVSTPALKNVIVGNY